MKVFFFVVFFQSIFFSVSGQTKIANCLYIGTKDKYVLSETATGGQTLNSLFIWERDRVIRIVFLYDRKISKPPNVNVRHLPAFTGFLPSFKEYIVSSGHYAQMHAYMAYEGGIVDKKENETNGYDYSIKLKTAINGRNERYNPLADKFARIPISDGDPEVMLYNEKRKGKLINNFPLLFTSASGDSSYIVSPLLINIYRLDGWKSNVGLLNDKITRYKLYSTVSFLKQTLTLNNYQTYWEDYKSAISAFVPDRALPYLYKMQSQVDEAALMKFLTGFPMAKQKFYSTSDIDIKVDTPVEITPINPDPKTLSVIRKNRSGSDSINAAMALDRIKYKNDCFRLYEYCTQCYNAHVSKTERIKMHCPINISMNGAEADENWSYAFSSKKRNYFQVESDPENRSVIPMANSSDMPQRWQMMSPGIGYWMTNIATENRHYQGTKSTLLLNGVDIRDKH
jgi:hypothetical protein